MIIKISPDFEKAHSLLEMAERSEEYLKQIISKVDISEYQDIPVRTYHEIMRELAGALMLIAGYKTIGENAHKETIDFLSRYKEITQDDIFEMQELRMKRNQNSYEGKPIKSPYLENKRTKFDKIIAKLKKMIRNRLK
jgi:hypothetical protein